MDPQLVIRLGRVPREVRHFRAMAGGFEVGEDEILLRAPGVGRFFMERGETLTVDTAPGISRPLLRVYVLGMALSAILHQRGFMVLHGGACVLEDGAAVFIGSSGAGKSTTVAAFAARGVPILSDDMLTIGFDAEGYPLVCPGLPTVKLWPETAKVLLPKPIAPFPQASLLKTRVHLPRVLARRPRRLSNLFELRWSVPGGARPSREPVETFSAIPILTRHAFHMGLITALGQQREFLAQAARIIQFCKLWRLRRSSSLHRIHELLEELE